MRFRTAVPDFELTIPRGTVPKFCGSCHGFDFVNLFKKNNSLRNFTYCKIPKNSNSFANVYMKSILVILTELSHANMKATIKFLFSLKNCFHTLKRVNHGIYLFVLIL